MAKRVLSFVLAAISVLGLWAPAYAEEDAGQPQQTPEAAETAAPEASQEPAREEPAPSDEPEPSEGPEDTEPEPSEEPKDEAPENGGTADEEPADGSPALEEGEPEAAPSEAEPIAAQPGDPSEPGGHWVKSHKRWYYKYSDGSSHTGWLTEGGKQYYLDSSGVMQTGWKLLKDASGDASHWYWFASNGAMATGWKKLKGKWYYLSTGKEVPEDAAVVSMQSVSVPLALPAGEEGPWQESEASVDGTQPQIATEFWITEVPADLASAAPELAAETQQAVSTATDTELQTAAAQSTPLGAMITGKWVIDGKTYYLESSGVMAKGWKKISGTWYYFSSNGAMATGWKKLKGKWYYLNPDANSAGRKGEMLTGLRQIGDKVYYLKSSGVMATGWVKAGGEWYYLNANGAAALGWKKVKGKWYYLNPVADEKGPRGAMLTGWLDEGGKTYYLKSSGAMAKGWLKVDGTWYYFYSGGSMATDWKKWKGKWYYLNPVADERGPKGAMLTGWQDVDGKTYYLKSSGVMATGWLQLNGVWYYLNSSGAQLTGWATIKGAKYYLDPNSSGHKGAAAVGWRSDIDAGKRYYFKSSCALATGPTYFDGEGVMRLFDSSGALQTNTTVYLCRQTYNVDSDGVIEGYVTTAGKKAVKVLNKVGWSLKSAYYWAAGLTYANRSYRAGSIEAYANYGFDHGYGNCFVMNSCLYEMAKMMGYDVRMRNGGVGHANGSASPHGWCEIKIGSTWYVFDSNFHNETGRNGYKIKYGQSGTWAYVKYGYLK